MTVNELMEVLSQLDPDRKVMLWNSEWGQKDPIDGVDLDEDGDVVLI